MTEQIQQWICIKFCIKLEHSLGNYLNGSEGHSYGQLVTSYFITTILPLTHHVFCRVFFVKHQITQVTQLPSPQSRFGTLELPVFPKTRITFESKEISDCRWDSGKYDGAADGDWENCVRSQGAYFEGNYVQCFLYFISSSISVSIFHITCLDTFWTHLIYVYQIIMLYTSNLYNVICQLYLSKARVTKKIKWEPVFCPGHDPILCRRVEGICSLTLEQWRAACLIRERLAENSQLYDQLEQ